MRQISQSVAFKWLVYFYPCSSHARTGLLFASVVKSQQHGVAPLLRNFRLEFGRHRRQTGGAVSLPWFKLLLLFVGGGLGTLARYGLNGVISARVATFPLGTMIVNITGCFAIGFLAAIADPSFGRMWLKTGWRDFLMVGFCGGYTTFSSYGIQTLNLARDGEWLLVAGNIIGSNALGLVAVYLGWVLGRFLQAKFHGGAL